MTLDWSFVPGMDLTRDPVVTVEDGWEVRRWPGCRIFTPQALGDAEASSAIPDACREPHGSNQEPVDAILTDLWPTLAECRTAKELGAAIIAAGVPKKLKRPVALAARDRLGKDWSEKTLQGWLSPRWHSEEALASRADAKLRWRSSPENREAARAKTADYYADPANRERKRANSAAWYEANPDARRDYANARYRDDPVFAASTKVRNRVSAGLRAALAGKSAPRLELLGCSIEELMAHLESLWEPGMTWDNWSPDGWHLDHLVPLAAFDLRDPEQQRQAYNWRNCVPRWAADNLSKGALHGGRRWSHRDHE